jgi:hypothetical protein
MVRGRRLENTKAHVRKWITRVIVVVEAKSKEAFLPRFNGFHSKYVPDTLDSSK